MFFAPSAPKCIFIALLPKSQSHPQMQCCQCVVGCQCLSNVLCSFISNIIPLCMVDFSQKYFRCIVAKITISPLNAMLPMCCWLPMLVQCSLLLLLQFDCPVNVSVRSVFSLHCCQNHNLTPKCNVVNVLLVANACPIFFAPSTPILWPCEWLISVRSIFVALLPKSQSHLQMQCCQCVVGCQCLSNVLCSFISNEIAL